MAKSLDSSESSFLKCGTAYLLFSLCFGFFLCYSFNYSSLNALNFLFVMLLSWGIYSYCLFSKTAFNLKQVLIGAVIFRIIAAFTNPLMEDDYFRYLWNGYQLVEFGNIRTIPPMDFFSADIPEDMSAILSGINNPHLPSIYSPLTEYVFALSYVIAPGKLIVIKLCYLLVEAGAVFFTYKLFSRKQLFLLLWNPLIIFESYVNAHPDIMAMSFLLLSWSMFKKKNWFLLGIFLGLAFSSRIFIILCLPVLFLSLKAFAGFLLSGLLTYSPFLLAEKSLGSIGNFLNEWEFNSSFFGLIRYFSDYQIAKWACAFLALAFIALYWFRFYKGSRVQMPEKLHFDILFLGFFLFSAVFNPWYSIVAIPFMIINERYLLMFIPLALSLSYIHGLNIPSSELAAYEVPVGILATEYLIIFFCILKTFKNRLQSIPHHIYNSELDSNNEAQKFKPMTSRKNQ